MICKKCNIENETENKFCIKCGSILKGDVQAVKVDGDKHKKGILWKILLSLSPIFFIFIFVTAWGLLSLIPKVSGKESVFINIFVALIPVLIGLCVLLVPVGIIFAIYFFINKNDN